MLQHSNYLLLADLILVIHVLFVCFVVLGLAGIYLGFFLHWHWVRNRWFRLLHLCAISIVVLQSWLGLICPLTLWERALRTAAGSTEYSGSFIQHWLQEILYYTAPYWVFLLVYTLFAGLVVASWFIVRPAR
jgi:hypothetical protein